MYIIYRMDLKENKASVEYFRTLEQASTCYYNNVREHDDTSAIFLTNDDGTILESNATMIPSDDGYYDDSNLEVGYDPYMGCYTEDC